MDTVFVCNTQNRLSELCNQVAETGGSCIISRRGEPVVKLVPMEDPPHRKSVWNTLAES